MIRRRKKVDGSLTAFSYKELQKATKNFSEKLGGGGFGSVFKGILPNATVIAVKKLESIGQGEKQFRADVLYCVLFNCIIYIIRCLVMLHIKNVIFSIAFAIFLYRIIFVINLIFSNAN